MTLTSREIHTHSLAGSDGSETVRKALALLRPYLPVSIPIYRRLQFGRFFPDTTLLTNLPSLDNAQPGGQWIIAFVDRTCRPETEVWWCGSWEAERGEEANAEVEGILKELFHAVRALRVPESLHQDVLDAAAAKAKGANGEGDNDGVKDKSGVSRADYAAHLLNPDIILCGAIHEKSAMALKRTGLIRDMFQGPKHTQMVPNHTFVFDVDGEKVSAAAEKARTLPAALTWGELRYEHFKIVRARTQIPRQDKTLAVLPSLAIYEGDVPVAWTFVGLDGSLTTLHVEEQWRGRGLAKAIAAKLFTEKMDLLWEDGGKRMAHGYVVNGNEESVYLCKSLGGVSEWETYWVRVDL